MKLNCIQAKGPILRTVVNISLILVVLGFAAKIKASAPACQITETNKLINIRILEVEYPKEYANGELSRPVKPSNSDAVFVKVSLLVENISGVNLDNFAPVSAAKLLDVEGSSYRAMSLGEWRQLPTMQQLSKNQKIRGSLMFEVPRGTKFGGLLWSGYPSRDIPATESTPPSMLHAMVQLSCK